MVPFDVATGRSLMISDSGGVTNLIQSFEVLRHSVLQTSFSFTNVESITIPGVSFFRTVAKLRPSFLTKIVSTARRNRRVSTKPVAGIVMLSILLHTKRQHTMGNLFVEMAEMQEFF